MPDYPLSRVNKKGWGAHVWYGENNGCATQHNNQNNNNNIVHKKKMFSLASYTSSPKSNDRKRRRLSGNGDGNGQANGNSNGNGRSRRLTSTATTTTITTGRVRVRGRGREGDGNVADGTDDTAVCSFCRQVPPAVSVQIPIVLRKKRASTPFCLACYYTTSAIRQDPEKYVSVLDQGQLDEQLPPLQQMFSEVYVELQRELSEESAKAFQKQKKDPLAMLLNKNVPSRRMSRVLPPPPPPVHKKKAGNSGDGGFLRHTPLPERLLQTQRQQAKLQQAQIDRMNKAATGVAPSTFSTTTATTTVPGLQQQQRRRSSSRKSIWNLALDPKSIAAAGKESKNETVKSHDYLPTCSCGSKDVESFGNITSRNQDLKKGETWGMKDRGDEVVARYRCNECGKTWNEEE